MTKVGIVGVMGACLALTSCAKVATPPPPTTEAETKSDSSTTVSITETVDLDVPPCKGTDICEICGSGGDCGRCPLCNPSACAPEVCETCIDVFKVPEIAELKVDGRKGPLVIANAQSVSNDSEDVIQEFDTDTLSVCIYAEDKLEQTDVAHSVIEQTGVGQTEPEVTRYSVGSTKYVYNGKEQSLTVSQDGYTYEITWQDEQGYYDASLFAAIVSNEQYDMGETGCPLSQGVRVDKQGSHDANAGDSV